MTGQAGSPSVNEMMGALETRGHVLFASSYSSKFGYGDINKNLYAKPLSLLSLSISGNGYVNLTESGSPIMASEELVLSATSLTDERLAESYRWADDPDLRAQRICAAQRAAGLMIDHTLNLANLTRETVVTGFSALLQDDREIRVDTLEAQEPDRASLQAAHSFIEAIYGNPANMTYKWNFDFSPTMALSGLESDRFLSEFRVYLNAQRSELNSANNADLELIAQLIIANPDHPDLPDIGARITDRQSTLGFIEDNFDRMRRISQSRNEG